MRSRTMCRVSPSTNLATGCFLTIPEAQAPSCTSFSQKARFAGPWIWMTSTGSDFSIPKGEEALLRRRPVVIARPATGTQTAGTPFCHYWPSSRTRAHRPQLRGRDGTGVGPYHRRLAPGLVLAQWRFGSRPELDTDTGKSRHHGTCPRGYRTLLILVLEARPQNHEGIHSHTHRQEP